MYKYLVSVPSMLVVQRGINFIFTYFVALLMAVKGYAAYSLMIYICNLSYQILKYGVDYRYQKLLNRVDKQCGRGGRLKKILGFYLSKLIILSVVAFFLAILIYCMLFAGQLNLAYLDIAGIWFLVFSLFGAGFIVTNTYAYRINGVIETLLSLQLMSMLVAVGLLFWISDYSFFLVFALSSFVPVLTTIVFYYPCVVKIDIKSLCRVRISFKNAFRPERLIYINNISINIFQLILIHQISLIAVTWIAEYRILQTLHAALSLAPLAATGFLINSASVNRSGNSNHGNFQVYHAYVFLCGILVFFRSSVSGFFPGYSQVIMEYLPFFLALNSVTIISNSFIFSVYDRIPVKRYLWMLLVACVVNAIILNMFNISNFKQLLVFDVLLQVVFYIALLCSFGRQVFNKINIVNWLCVVAIIGLYTDFDSNILPSLMIILISSYYFLF